MGCQPFSMRQGVCPQIFSNTCHSQPEKKAFTMRSSYLGIVVVAMANVVFGDIAYT